MQRPTINKLPVAPLRDGSVDEDQYLEIAIAFFNQLGDWEVSVEDLGDWFENRSNGFYAEMENWLTTTDATVTINGEEIQSFKALQNEFTDPAAHPTHAQLATALAGYASAQEITDAVDALSPQFTAINEAIDTKKTKREITYISQSQHNNLMMIIDGKLYTTSGTSGSNDNAGTGRGLDGEVATYGLDNLKEVYFADLPATAKLVEVGGDGYSICWARFDNNWLYTWGKNTNYVCGAGHASPIATPLLVLTDCTKVYNKYMTDEYSIFYQAFIVQRADGYPYGAGNGGDGCFGLGNLNNLQTFTKLEWMGQNPKSIWLNRAFGGSLYVQKADDRIWAAGNGEGGTLFTGISHTGQHTAHDITNAVGGIDAGEIIFAAKSHRYHNGSAIAGSSKAMVVRRDANNVTRMYTVGNGEWGWRGDGTTNSSVAPFFVPGMDDIKEVAWLGGNVPQILVLTNSKNLYFWGYRESQNHEYSPELIMTDVDEILTKNQTSHVFDWRVQMLIKKGTDVYSFGYDNVIKYLALSTTTNQDYPVKNTFLSRPNDPVKMIGTFTTSSHGRALVAITESNKKIGWAYNNDYALTSDSALPVKVPTEFGEII